MLIIACVVGTIAFFSGILIGKSRLTGRWFSLAKVEKIIRYAFTSGFRAGYLQGRVDEFLRLEEDSPEPLQTPEQPGVEVAPEKKPTDN